MIGGAEVFSRVCIRESNDWTQTVACHDVDPFIVATCEKSHLPLYAVPSCYHATSLHPIPL